MLYHGLNMLVRVWLRGCTDECTYDSERPSLWQYTSLQWPPSDWPYLADRWAGCESWSGCLPHLWLSPWSWLCHCCEGHLQPYSNSLYVSKINLSSTHNSQLFEQNWQKQLKPNLTFCILKVKFNYAWGFRLASVDSAGLINYNMCLINFIFQN